MNKNAKPIISLFTWYALLVYFNLIGMKLLENSSKLSNNLFETFTYIVIIISLIIINKMNIKKEIIDFKKNYKNYLKNGLIYWIIGLFLMIGSNYIITIYQSLPSNEILIRNNLSVNFIFMFLSSVIISPILEEILFRYSFSKIKNKYIYIIISSLLFALVHISSFTELIFLIPYGFLGLAFTLTYYKNKNIISSIIIHTLHNYFVLLIITLF